MTTTGSSHDQRVALRGRLDVSTVGDVRTCLHDLLGEGTGDLLVDVADVDVADATGLGVLVGAHRRAERLERHLVLVGVTPKLTRLLRLTRLHRILRVRVEAAAA
ncbi:anti-sigma factor antagonist [Motilibacter rhizosphaerae]|uniref:anti-sigma factor antagonist n=1 Tax=Motilibacter rhizosphaerae TaxID=598652 RepID=UPI00102CA45D